MKIENKIYYITPVLLSLMILASNFLSSGVFGNELINFAVWFILSIFAFAFGWIITNTLGWSYGGRVVIAVIIASSLLTMFFVTLFHEYFNVFVVVTENVILYLVRNVYLGLMGIFGMTVSELINTQRTLDKFLGQEKSKEEIISDAERRAQLIIDEAKLKSDKIIFKAEKDSENISKTKIRTANQLKELIRIEKDLINKYDTEKN